MNLKKIFSLVLVTLFSLPSLHASSHLKKAAAVTTLVAASTLSGQSEKKEKVIKNRKGETFAFHGNGTVSVKDIFGNDLGTHPTNNDNPLAHQNIELVKQRDKSGVLVGSGLKGGMLSQENQDDEKKNDEDSHSGPKEVIIHLTTKSKNGATKSPPKGTITKKLNALKRTECLCNDYSVYDLSFTLNPGSKGLDNDGLKTFVLGPEKKLGGAVGKKRVRFQVEENLAKGLLGKRDWEFQTIDTLEKEQCIDSIMAVDPAGFSKNSNKDETGYAVVKRRIDGSFAVIDVGGFKLDYEDDVEQANEIFNNLAEKASTLQVNRILVENQTFGKLWSTFFKFWIQNRKEYKHIEITTFSPATTAGEGKFERIIQIMVPLLKDKKVFFSKGLLKGDVSNKIIKEVNRLRVIRSKSEQLKKVGDKITALQGKLQWIEKLKKLRAKDRAIRLKSELTGGLPEELREQLDIAEDFKELEEVKGAENLLNACEDLIKKIHSQCESKIKELETAAGTLDKCIEEFKKKPKNIKRKKYDTWMEQLYAILLEFNESSFHDDRIDALAMGLAFLDPEVCIYSLDLSCSLKLSCDSLIHLKRLSALNILHLRGCDLEKEALEAIAQIVHLTELDLSENETLSEAGERFLCFKSLLLLNILNVASCALTKQDIKILQRLKLKRLKTK